MLDRYGRNINYLRVSLTDRCNLRCIYCMPKEGVDRKSHEDIMRFEEVLNVVKASAVLGIKKIRYTGGEPLILSGVEKLIYETFNIPGIEDISITTNGILLGDMADDLKKAGLKRVNISLDTLKEDKYRDITRGGKLGDVLSAIDKCVSIGLKPVKINTVLLKGINDDEIPDFIRMTKDMPVEIRFIELMPIGEGIKLYKDREISTEEILEAHPELRPIKRKSGSTAKLFALENAMGTVGCISPMSCKFCNECNRIRLTPSGTIKPCLHSESEINIRDHVDNQIELIRALRDAIYNKPAEHHLEIDNESKSRRMMFQIGG